MTVQLVDNLEDLRISDTAVFDVFEDFTGNLSVLLSYLEEDADGNPVDAPTPLWQVDTAEMVFGADAQFVSPPEVDGSKTLADGTGSTHRADALFGGQRFASLYYNETTGAYALVIDAQTVNALLSVPQWDGYPDDVPFTLPFIVTATSPDGEQASATLAVEIVSARADVPLIEVVPSLTISAPRSFDLRDSLISTEAHDDIAADILFTLLDTPAVGELRHKNQVLQQGDHFTRQQLDDGELHFFIVGPETYASVTLSFSVKLKDRAGEGETVSFELRQNRPETNVPSSSGRDVVDLSSEPEARIIATGDGGDDITGSQADDEINPGLGDDVVRLGQQGGGADKVVYRVSSTGVAVDGGDTIKNFKRGQDKLELQMDDGRFETIDGFLSKAAGTDDTPLSHDDLVVLKPMMESGDEGMMVRGMRFHFRSSGTYDGGTKLSGSKLKIEFDEALSVAAFFEAIGGSQNFDMARLAVKDAALAGDLFGLEGLSVSSAVRPLISLPQGGAGVMRENLDGQIDTGIVFEVSDTPVSSSPAAWWFKVYESSDAPSVSERFAVIEQDGQFKLVLREGHPVIVSDSADLDINLFIEASDGVVRSEMAEVRVTVNHIDYAPHSLALSRLEVMEEREGAVIGTLSAVDEDAHPLTYSLEEVGHYELFEIVDNQLKLKDGVAANYEVKNLFQITVTAHDPTQRSTSSDFAIEVRNDDSETQAATYLDKGFAALYPDLELPRHLDLVFSGSGWTPTLGVGRDLTFSFVDPDVSRFAEDYPRNLPAQTLPIEEPMKERVRELMTVFEEVCLVNFKEVEETADGTTGQIRFALYTGERTFIMNWPADTSREPAYTGGDLWFTGELETDGVPNFNIPKYLVDGSWYSQAIIHEMGHAMGLSHTQHVSKLSSPEYGDVEYGKNLWEGSPDNTRAHSIMSYHNYYGERNTSISLWSEPTSLMTSDIALMQYMYGVNEQTRRGDDVYTLSSFTQDTPEDFVYATIWDTGGIDTLSWADQTSTAIISLEAGKHSFFGNVDGYDDSSLGGTFRNGAGTLGIAFGVDIENAIGGQNEDFIVGNHLDNILFGGPKFNETDKLTGGAGADLFVCALAHANSGSWRTYGDVIYDFTDNEDRIGLADVTFDDVSWVEASWLDRIAEHELVEKTGVRLYHTASQKTLFLLEGIDVSVLDESDFQVTSFVSDFV